MMDTVKVEMAFGSEPLDLTNHVWTDVTEWVQNLRTTRGRTSVTEYYQAGTAAIQLDNRDRRFDPLNLSGPYVSGGVTQVVPAVPVKVTITHAATPYCVWFGFLDDPMSWEPEFPDRSSMTVTATDPMRILAAALLPQLVDPIEEGWPPGWRIIRILQQVGWDVNNWAQIANGDTPLEATIDGGNALSQIQNCVLGDAGYFLFRPVDQKFVFFARLAAASEPRQKNTQATFDDETGRYYSQPRISHNELLYNEVRLTRESGALFETRDQASIDKYFLRTYDVSGAPILYDAYAEARTDYYLQAFKNPTSGFSSITVQAVDPASLEHEYIADVQIRDKINVTLANPPGGGDEIRDSELTVEAVTLTVSPSLPLTMTLGLTSGARLDFNDPDGWLLLDDPFYGQLDGPFNIAY